VNVNLTSELALKIYYFVALCGGAAKLQHDMRNCSSLCCKDKPRFAVRRAAA
jgi:hypothetical protein